MRLLPRAASATFFARQGVDTRERKQHVIPPKRRFWKEEQKDEIRISKEALFKGVSTGFGLRTIEKSVENPDFIFLFLLPKSSFGERTFSWHYDARPKSWLVALIDVIIYFFIPTSTDGPHWLRTRAMLTCDRLKRLGGGDGNAATHAGSASVR